MILDLFLITTLNALGILAYNLFLLLYKTGLRMVSPWNPKVRLWLKGRESLYNKIQDALEKERPETLIWMHCASLGEFEQGRPLLEKLRRIYPGARLALTFFSSSGYEIRKDYNGADYVFYLPLDSRKNAVRFLNIIQPRLVLWVKYDYWYYYLDELRNRNIPVLLLSGLFWKEQLFFKWYGGIYRKILKTFTHIFVQDTHSKELLNALGFRKNVSVSGDTRFDRVIEIAEQFKPIGVIEHFCGGHPVIVAGSTWLEDEEELDHFANTHPSVKCIIAPHEISPSHLATIQKLFHRSILYSDLTRQADSGKPIPGINAADENQYNVLIIDNIGMLSKLYRYATIAYIGGGFGNDGIHNILEAAVYGKPVIFGPVHHKFIEAKALVDAKGAFPVGNALELEALLNELLNDPEKYQNACSASAQYVYINRGATDAILQYIKDNGFL